MRDKMERLVVLPFSVGCVSHSSVALGTAPPNKPKPEPNSAVTRRREREESIDSSVDAEKMKSSWRFLAVSKPNVSNRIHRLVKSIKSFSQLFVYKEEREMEMEIGLPTDVKHVTHIGWDGTTTTNPVKGWENLTPPELLSFPSVSLKQFELAMAAQTCTSVPPSNFT
ncbi:CRIB domain-containing protein [Actinidia chinensis var. chinensis]|uniref:CRIB domain-containing protein n=1 Tax=Actinidia chinensis var. chinensis TaxID=1590841 RepID=A0A2R6R8Y9_ACTCC|nr:CRIB domain-containing protein [Actinidia chinensis var. chinensis]